MVVLASPRLAVMEIIWVASISAQAASRPPCSSKKRCRQSRSAVASPVRAAGARAGRDNRPAPPPVEPPASGPSARSRCGRASAGTGFPILEEYPGVERAQSGTSGAQKTVISTPTRCRSPTTAPPTQRPLTVQVLGGGMNDQIGAQWEGLLQGGVQKQLSTTSRQPCAWARSASARISASSISGLDGVSR